ncbi:MAG: DUF4153 domain-containing protein [Bacteroidia bacterium]|nr:DUF4153 domain-containing protein [Bacteroidia bacterium]
MKIISIKNLVTKGTETLVRFPLPLLFAIGATGVGMYLVGLDYRETKHADRLYCILMACVLSAVTFIGVKLYTERQKTKPLFTYLINVAFLVALSLYYFMMPDKLNEMYVIKFFQTAIAIHLFVSFIPFAGFNEPNGFWQYNKALFLRLLTAALYSGVLYIGLSLALLAIDNLFGVKINGNTYARLFFFIAGIFNTWFFLAGIPKNLEELQNDTSYPKGLKVFSQYVLLPLVGVYLLILYVYLFKIILQWHLPEGWVSYLILSFSVAGIFSFLLLYPIQSYSENKWIRLYSRIYYFALIPLIVLLLVAIFRRISDYGITENRYFVFVLAIWLCFITLFMLVKRLTNIKEIPLTLGLIALLTSFGPWSATSVALKSQTQKFEYLINEYHLLKNSKIIKCAEELPFKARQNLSSAVEYISEVHSYKLLQKYYRQNLDSLFPDTTYSHKPTELLKIMGIQYISRWQREDYANENFYFSTDRFNSKHIFNITGYRQSFMMNEYFGYLKEDKDSVFSSDYVTKDTTVTVKYVSKTGILSFNFKDSLHIDISLFQIVDSLKKKHKIDEYSMKATDMVMKEENERLKVMMIVSSINGNYTDTRKKIRINNIQGDVFLCIKPEVEKRK